VAAGELVAVTGPSGSGKSTLLACLAGVEEPDGGSVTIVGRRISHRPEPERTRMRGEAIGVLLQEENLVDHLSVEENVRLAGRLRGGEHRRDGDGSRRVLAAVGLTGQASALPSTLSGGEAARAGLAVALVGEPAVVLADEPTGELDAATEVEVLQLLRQIAERGTAVVVAGHSAAVAAAADRVITLVDGRIAA
jgi:putative ABC transport system ATP-binding protein